MSKQLTFFDASQFTELTATIHKSGNICFSAETQRRLKLNKDMVARFAIDSDDSIYVEFSTNKGIDAFTLHPAGTYYYCKTALLFDYLKIDYKNENVKFILSKNGDGYTLTRTYDEKYFRHKGRPRKNQTEEQ